MLSHDERPRNCGCATLRNFAHGRRPRTATAMARDTSIAGKASYIEDQEPSFASLPLQAHVLHNRSVTTAPHQGWRAEANDSPQKGNTMRLSPLVAVLSPVAVGFLAQPASASPGDGQGECAGGGCGT